MLGSDLELCSLTCSTHLSNARKNVESGGVVMGGAILDEAAADGKPLKITGSAMVFRADTKEEVLEQVKQDVYYKGDVWDKEKVRRERSIVYCEMRLITSQVQILPFLTAFRKGLD